MAAASAPLKVVLSAVRIALRSSRNDGFGRRELHGPGHERLGPRRAEGVAQVPQGLRPDLAVRVHLGAADHLAVVGVGVAAGVPGRAARAGRGGVADLAVQRLGAVHGGAGSVVLEEHDVRGAGHVGLEALGDQVVHGVPVAPGLAHRPGLHLTEGGVAGGVDDQPVRQAVGVLVVDGVGLVARRWSARTGPRRGTTCRAGAGGTSASSAPGRRAGCSCSRCRCASRRAVRPRCSRRRRSACRRRHRRRRRGWCCAAGSCRPPR